MTALTDLEVRRGGTFNGDAEGHCMALRRGPNDVRVKCVLGNSYGAAEGPPMALYVWGRGGTLNGGAA